MQLQFEANKQNLEDAAKQNQQYYNNGVLDSIGNSQVVNAGQAVRLCILEKGEVQNA